MKTTMLLAVVAALALVIPATASAAQWVESGTPITEPLEWTDGGSALTGEQAISLEGPIKFSNATIGGIECNYAASGTLSAGNEGVLYEFAPISLGGCKLSGSGFLKTSCSSVTSATIYSSWPLEVAEKSPGVRTMTVKMGKIVYTFQPNETEFGKYCPTPLEITGGSITATPDNAKSMSSVSLSGQVGTSGTYGKLNTTCTLAVKPAARFGVVRRENVAALSGYIKFTNAAIGGVECAVTGSLILRPGEKGEVTAMSSKANGCVVTGPRATECGSTATAVFKEVPWSLSITAAKTISIAKFPFEIQFGKGCSSWNMTGGEMVATPDNTSAISSTTLSGTLTGSPFSMKWTGALSWSPGGKYGIG